MVIDGMMWLNEIDVLVMRLKMLSEHVDVFVIVESDHTHSGDHKGWNLMDYEDRLEPWKDKIEWVTVKGTIEYSWNAENRQRRQIQEAVARLDPMPKDIVVFSDADEIWNPDCLKHWRSKVGASRQEFLIMSMWWRYPGLWPGSIGGPWSIMGGVDWQQLRDQRYSLPEAGTGWHLSWMGDIEQMRYKAQSFAHYELADMDVSTLLNNGVWVDGVRYEEVVRELPGPFREAPEHWFRVRGGIILPEEVRHA